MSSGYRPFQNKIQTATFMYIQYKNCENPVKISTRGGWNWPLQLKASYAGWIQKD
jgi:hypothetical protein